MTAEPAGETPAIETRPLKHGLTAVLLSHDAVGPATPTEPEAPPATSFQSRRSRRARGWGEASSPRSTPWGLGRLMEIMTPENNT